MSLYLDSAEMQENEYISEAARLCEYYEYTPAELARYDGYWDAVRRYKTVMNAAKSKTFEETNEKRTANIKTNDSLIRVVIKSDEAGLPPQTISSITGLTNKEIITILNTKT